jgi:anti-sigma regulatory factor (Ser/Thr protein kinase)
MTTGTALQASVTIPGLPAHVQAARQFVARTMGAGRPGTDLGVLLTSEIVTNSIVHSDSGLPRGTVTITVSCITGGFRVEVLDAGGRSVPQVAARKGPLAEGGQGLYLVSELSASWGYRVEGTGVVTWFEVSAEPGPEAGPLAKGARPR